MKTDKQKKGDLERDRRWGILVTYKRERKLTGRQRKRRTILSSALLKASRKIILGLKL